MVFIKGGSEEMRILLRSPGAKYARGAPWQATNVPEDEWEAALEQERKTA
jgi:hypothetical protein